MVFYCNFCRGVTWIIDDTKKCIGTSKISPFVQRKVAWSWATILLQRQPIAHFFPESLGGFFRCRLVINQHHEFYFMKSSETTSNMRKLFYFWLRNIKKETHQRYNSLTLVQYSCISWVTLWPLLTRPSQKHCWHWLYMRHSRHW